MLLLSQPSNQSHARKDSKFVTFVVQQQRGQEAETQPHQRVGAGRPAALRHLGTGQPAQERGWRGAGGTRAGTDMPGYSSGHRSRSTHSFLPR